MPAVRVCEEINTGRALVMNSLRLATAAGGGTTLSWTPPYRGDGQTVGAYKIGRRVHGNGRPSFFSRVFGALTNRG